MATFLNVTLPIGGRIALPSSINTYISVVKNTSLMYVISYPELTTTVLQIQALTLETVETFTVLAVTYLILVWTMSALIRLVESRLALPGGALDEPSPTGSARSPTTCSTEGCVNTLKIAAIALAGSTLIGITLGTLLTIRFLPLRALIRLYIEVWRGLPILVTIFIIFFVLPSVSLSLRFDALTAAAIGLILWGSAQVAEATRGRSQSIPREQHEAASALGFGWVGRHAFVIMPQALRRLLPPVVGLLVNIIQNTTIAQVIGANELLESGKRQVERLTAPPPIGLGEIHSFEIYGAVMVIFFLISFPLTRLAAYLERRLVCWACRAPCGNDGGPRSARAAVAVAQLVEPRVVVPVVAGSSPVRHLSTCLHNGARVVRTRPAGHSHPRARPRDLRTAALVGLFAEFGSRATRCSGSGSWSAERR